MQEAASLAAYRGNIPRLQIFNAVQNFELSVSIWIIYLRDDRGLSFGAISNLEALVGVVFLVLEVPTGVFADRFGRKTAIVLGSLLLPPSMLTFGLASEYWLLLVAYLLWGAGSSLKSGADTALLYDSLRLVGQESQFTRIQGRLHAVTLTAVLFAGVIGAVLADVAGLQAPFLVSAAMGLIAAAIALTLAEPPTSSRSSRSYLATARSGLATIWRTKPVLYAMLFGGLAGATDIVNMFTQPFLVDHGAPLSSLGVLDVPVRLASIAGSYYAFRVARRWGDWRFFLATPLLLAIAWLALAGLDTAYAFSMFPLISLINHMREPMLVGYINERVPSGERATVLSVANVAFSLPVSMLLPVVGVLASAGSSPVAFLFLAAYSVIALIPVLAVWHRRPH